MWFHDLLNQTDKGSESSSATSFIQCLLCDRVWRKEEISQGRSFGGDILRPVSLVKIWWESSRQRETLEARTSIKYLRKRKSCRTAT